MAKRKRGIEDSLDARCAGASGGWNATEHRRALRKAFEECVTPNDFKRIAKKLLIAAEAGLDAGEVRAAAELLDRLLGKATQHVDVEAGESVKNLLEALAAARESQE